MITLRLYVWTFPEVVGVQPLKSPSVMMHLCFFTINLLGHEGHVSIDVLKLIIVLVQLLDKNLPLRCRENSVHEDAPLAPIY